MRDGETEGQGYRSWDRLKLPAAGTGEVALPFICVNCANSFNVNIKKYAGLGDSVLTSLLFSKTGALESGSRETTFHLGA